MNYAKSIARHYRKLAKRKEGKKMFTISFLLTTLVILIIAGILIYAVYLILGMLPIPQPIKTLIWLLLAVIFLVAILNATGIYHIG